LGKTARLGLAGHKEDVAAGVHGSRERGVVEEGRREPPFVIELGRGEEMFEVPVSPSEEGELDVGVHHFLKDRRDEIHSFVLHQTSYRDDERDIGALGESEQLLQLGLAGGFAAQVLVREGLGDIAVR
jgi:hypothetical protein